VVLLALLTAGLFWRGEQVAKYEAAARLNGFRDDLSTARLLLGARAADVDQLSEGREAARRALDRLPGRRRRAAGASNRSVRPLPEEERIAYRRKSANWLVLLAAPRRVRTTSARALRMNRLAENRYPEGRVPRALWAQRARLEALLGHDDEARRQRERADATPVRDDWDEYLLAREQAGRGRLADAAERLRAVAVKEPANFAVQFLMSNCCPGRFYRPPRPGDGRRRLLPGACHRPAARLPRRLRQPRPPAPRPVRRGRGRPHPRPGLRPNQRRILRGPRPGRATAWATSRTPWIDLDRAEELGSTAVMLYYLRMQVHRRLGHGHFRPARPGPSAAADADGREGFRGARPGPPRRTATD